MKVKNNNLLNEKKDFELILIKLYNNKKNNQKIKNEMLLELYKKYKNVIYAIYKKYSFLNTVYEFEDFKQDSFLILIDAINYYKKGNNEKYSFGILFKWLLNNHCKHILNQIYNKQPDELVDIELSYNINEYNKIELQESIEQYLNNENSKWKNIIEDLKYFNKNEVCKHHKITYYQLNKILIPLQKHLA